MELRPRGGAPGVSRGQRTALCSGTQACRVGSGGVKQGAQEPPRLIMVGDCEMRQHEGIGRGHFPSWELHRRPSRRDGVLAILSNVGQEGGPRVEAVPGPFCNKVQAGSQMWTSHLHGGDWTDG